MKKFVCIFIFLLSLTSVLFAQKKVWIVFNYNCENRSYTSPMYYNIDSLTESDFAYTNAFGTKYLITDLELFVSNVAIRVDGKWMTNVTQIRDFDDYKKCYSEPFYLDGQNYELKNFISFPITAKKPEIDSIRFTFGIPKELNKSYSLEDPELARMYWPEVLGGGYHYMKLNIKFIDYQDSVSLFNCHLGRGVVGDTFVDNDFTITLPIKNLENKKLIKETQHYYISVTMNLEQWFLKPNPIDFNLYTKGIMGNQEVMGKIIENGKNVFSVSPIVPYERLNQALMK